MRPSISPFYDVYNHNRLSFNSNRRILVVLQPVVICTACEFEKAEDAGSIVPCNAEKSETRDTGS